MSKQSIELSVIESTKWYSILEEIRNCSHLNKEKCLYNGISLGRYYKWSEKTSYKMENLFHAAIQVYSLGCLQT